MKTLTDSFGNPIRTLCEICENSVPNYRDKGCDWSMSFKPVAGWDALMKPLNIGGRQVESYRVFSCPKYRKEPPRRLLAE